ncbi:hypothetical protein NQ317_002605, partial [Molorchus minor]
VFLCGTLYPKPRRYESAILNLDSEEGPGTHWVAYKKTGDSILYFDSFGSLKPPIELVHYFNPYKIRYNPDNPKYNYSLALIGFHTYNSIPNIESGVNNKFYYWELGDRATEKIINIPVGSYEIGDIEAYLQKRVVPSGAKQQSDSYFSLKPNNNTLKCKIRSKHEINFTPKDSLAALLGYSAQVLKPVTLCQSDLPVNQKNSSYSNPNFDESIVREEVRTYYPFVKSFGNNDEVEIAIYQQDSILLMSEAAIIIEGTLKKNATGTGTVVSTRTKRAEMEESIKQFVDMMREMKMEIKQGQDAIKEEMKQCQDEMKSAQEAMKN